MYKLVVGLEVHAELKTKSKVFSSSSNSYDIEPNINVSPLDLALPGTLPVLNKEALNKALKCAIALNCSLPDKIIFDRKNYFYPDLPKGYQITQATKPVGLDGYLEITVGEERKKVYLHDIHLEEDTASLDHFGDYSLIDYNRAGIPLIEIVTTPCMHSVDEVITFLEALRSVLVYCDISEAKTDKGQMRCDVNISLQDEGGKQLTSKVEIKNINSFNNVKDAIIYEMKRQSEAYERGEEVIQETRRFDDDKRKTFAMRSKVDAVDYKYYVEPNLPPFKIEESLVQDLKESIPILQFERIEKYMNEYGLSRYDSKVLVKDKEVSDYFEEVISHGTDYKLAANWVNGVILGHMNKFSLTIGEIYVKPVHISDLIDRVSKGSISIKQAKEVLYASLSQEKEPSDIIAEENIMQLSDDDGLEAIIVKVVEVNKHLIDDYRNGKNVLDYFVGQVMKETRGRANPALAVEMIKKEFEKY